uniref:Uncharacterized protein n=1 Tax=Marseillevirus LCMAC103 TaxID=2506604 RepID=A0A481YWV9_9VIRU|nr:MAG: hypothetical protein LCMAC103_03980 [Marseillevirus LCMAC103]
MGTEGDLKRNYERFAAACDVFRDAATQIQRIWRGVLGRRRTVLAKERYFAPDGPGYRAAETHFARHA